MDSDKSIKTLPEVLPTLNDIDPDTGKIYTKSKLKKIKKILDSIERKKENKAKIKKTENGKTNEQSDQQTKFETISLNPELPEAVSIRTCQAKDFIDKRVKVTGWVDRFRVQGVLIFLLVRDNSSLKSHLQCVLEGKLTKTREAANIHQETSVAVYGTIYEDKRAEGGFELRADYWEEIGSSSGEFTSIVSDDTNVSLAMDNRHLFLRKKEYAQIFTMRSSIIQCFREKLFNDKFTEVTPPTMVETQVEGGSTLFTLDYYGKPAYLTQSSQLYLETCIFSLGNVFCVCPSFRAEKTRTRRHLTEYTHLESEMPFISFEDLLSHLENLICSVCESVLERNKELLLEMNPDFKVPRKPFRRLDHKDAINFCRENNIFKDEETKEHFEEGDDIPEGPERKMIELIGEPTFLCRFPTHQKPFYMKKVSGDPSHTESVDVLIPGVGEIVGGSMRETDYDVLMNGFKDKRIDTSNYYWYTDLRKYGSVPHGGYGLGIERFLCWMLKRDHIRDVCLYPRFTNRCTP